MKLAIIDLGTNSVRFDVYDVADRTRRVKRIHREKQMVRLGDGVFKTGRLAAAAVKRTLAAFEGFVEKAHEIGVDRVAAYATSALRDSADSDVLVQAIRERTDIRLKIISGKQEAELIAKGILNNEEIPGGLFALVDIGGGSTEVSICRKRTVLDSFSFDLGANRLQQTFLRTSPPRAVRRGVDPVFALRTHIREIVSTHVRAREWPPVESIVGSSGTVKAIRAMLKRKGIKVQPFSGRALGELMEKLIPLNADQLARYPGMEPKRADLIVAGGVLLEELVTLLGARRVYTTEYSLRDGLLEAELERRR